MIRVYHNEKFMDFHFNIPDRIEENLRDELTLVAEVDSDDLNVAWKLTNTIDHAWTQNEGLLHVREGEQRSTSVGDVMELNGIFYFVDSVGFKKVPCDIPQCQYCGTLEVLYDDYGVVVCQECYHNDPKGHGIKKYLDGMAERDRDAFGYPEDELNRIL